MAGLQNCRKGEGRVTRAYFQPKLALVGFFEDHAEPGGEFCV